MGMFDGNERFLVSIFVNVFCWLFFLKGVCLNSILYNNIFGIFFVLLKFFL